MFDTDGFDTLALSREAILRKDPDADFTHIPDCVQALLTNEGAEYIGWTIDRNILSLDTYTPQGVNDNE